MVKAKDIEEVKNIALSLEAESGGVLVSVDKVSKGYAIIVFRGRDYKRPSRLRPTNLLTKRKALARSIELQRQQVPPQLGFSYFTYIIATFVVYPLGDNYPVLYQMHVVLF